MNVTRNALSGLRRPVKPVTLPGGDQVHVRDLTVAELRMVDARAAGDPVRVAQLMCLYALAEPDGSPAFPWASDEDLEELDGLTATQIEAVVRASVPTKGDAKN